MKTSFSVGRRWRCKCELPKPDFDFVILGKGTAYSRSVLCRIEVVGHDPNRRCWEAQPADKCRTTCAHGMEQEYPTAHIKKHAVLLKEKGE